MKKEQTKGKNQKWTIIEALDHVLSHAHDSHLSTEFWKEVRSACTYLKRKTHLSDIQILALAMLVDAGKPLSYAMMAKYLGISRIKMMCYTEELEDMCDNKRWATRKCAREIGGNMQGFGLVYGVVTALRHNQVFVPEDLSGMDTLTLVERLTDHIGETLSDDDKSLEEEEPWMMNLMGANPSLPLSRKLMELNDRHKSQLLLMYAIFDFAMFAGTAEEGITIRGFARQITEEVISRRVAEDLNRGRHPLFRLGLIEWKCDDGLADKERFVLTTKAKEELLAGFTPVVKSKLEKGPKDEAPEVIHWQDITLKQLYYNPREEAQVQRLRRLMSQEHLPLVQQRLQEQGMRTGVAVLLSGGPGTGKTELCRMLAAENHRDLMMVDLSQLRSKWVGESEKACKGIFRRYERLCQDSEHTPILFINECDAILGTRMESANNSVDKMENAIQNIMLQALEDLKGIVICTTNLAGALDPAFERRFLMRLCISRPSAEVRGKILHSMLPMLSQTECERIAEQYDLSGGQIENVVRKTTIECVLNGTTPTAEDICVLCREEGTSMRTGRTPIAGFVA